MSENSLTLYILSIDFNGYHLVFIVQIFCGNKML